MVIISSIKKCCPNGWWWRGSCMVCWVCGGVWATGSGEELESQERAETRALTQCSLDIYSQYCPHHHPPSLGHKLIINTLWDMVWMVRVLIRCGLQVAESPADTRPSRGERGELERRRRVEQWDTTELQSRVTSLCRRSMWCPLSIMSMDLPKYRAPLLLCLVINVFCIVITRVIK